MIIGKLRETDPDEDHEYYREESYRNDLDRFEGVPYTYHGVTDELDNLSQFLNVIGQSVLQQEKEFKEIVKEEDLPDNTLPTEKMIDNWYKKNYRKFSYKAMLTVIHGVFEKGLSDLYTILKENNRIAFHFENDILIEKLKEYKSLDQHLEPLILQVWPYNFIRNKILHSDGYFKKDDKGYQEFEKFLKGRTDINVEELRVPKSSFTHRMSILQSTILSSYLDLIAQIFKSLLKAARNASYMNH